MTAVIDRYRNNLRDEMNGAALYTALAAATRRDDIRDFGAAARNHSVTRCA
jgi:hypothetical protein